jgi:hypothetical protein
MYTVKIITLGACAFPFLLLAVDAAWRAMKRQSKNHR